MRKVCLFVLIFAAAATAQGNKEKYEKKLERLMQVDLSRDNQGNSYTLSLAVSKICKQADVPFLHEYSLEKCPENSIDVLKSPRLKTLGKAKKLIELVLHPHGYSYVVNDEGLYIEYAPEETKRIEEAKSEEEQAKKKERERLLKEKKEQERLLKEKEKQAKKEEQEQRNSLNWAVDFEQAKTMASRANRPILANFTGSDWCGWCKKLEREVFSQEEFVAYAQGNLICLKLDFPKRTQLPPALQQQNEELARRYGIRGYPTILLLDRTGKVIAKTGYQAGGAANYINHLNQLLNKRK